MTPAPPGVTPDRSAADVGVLLEFPNPISETSSHLTLSSSGESANFRFLSGGAGTVNPCTATRTNAQNTTIID